MKSTPTDEQFEAKLAEFLSFLKRCEWGKECRFDDGATIYDWWNNRIAERWDRCSLLRLVDIAYQQFEENDAVGNILVEFEGDLTGFTTAHIDRLWGEPEDDDERAAYVRSLQWMPAERRKR